MDRINIYKIGLVFYMISIFMLTNGLLFNVVFRGTPLVVWRQLIWLVGILFLYKVTRIKDLLHFQNIKLFKIARFFLISLIPLSAATYIYNGFNIIRIFYALIMYSYGLGFIFFVIASIKMNKEFNLFRFMAILGIFIGTGLLIDGVTNIFSAFHAVTSDLAARSEERAVFFVENPTSLGTFFALFFVSCIYAFYFSKNPYSKTFYFVGSLLMVGGAIITGSRQIVLPFLGIMFFSYGYLFIRSWKNSLFVFFSISLLVLFKPDMLFRYVQNNLLQNERYENIADDEAEGNNARKRAWEDGKLLFKADNAPYFLFGHGIASCAGQKAQLGEYVHKHYESAFYLTFYEGGLLAWYLHYAAVILTVLLLLKKKGFLKILLLQFLFVYVFIGRISPNATSLTAQMALFIVFTIAVNYNNFIIPKKV